MKTIIKFNFLLVALIVSLTSESVFAKIERIYIYTDSEGLTVFSDRQPQKDDYVEQMIQPLKTVTWIRSDITINQITQKQRKKATKPAPKSAKSICTKIKQDLQKTENALSKRQKPEEFDLLKTKLADLRWRYRKKCA
ncbi:hypothetical protein FLL45_02810 [Aliikangiella marina]|uniref:DUF4124 domain-containing protein n=1 Tax=Aliikangiella marina TaxID=1712262 RepID=A0A545TI40_9GAMM|nr:hypothetical protein [Aliikangiella marina]TQV76900.1 hypothetical protein FLL45_02810 [Aliikangiella marina]